MCSLGDLDEDAVVDLQETEELEDLSWLGCNLVDTLNSDDEDKLGLIINIEAAALAGYSSKSDFLTLGIAILLDVRLGTLEDSLALVLVCLQRCMLA